MVKNGARNRAFESVIVYEDWNNGLIVLLYKTKSEGGEYKNYIQRYQFAECCGKGLWKNFDKLCNIRYNGTTDAIIGKTQCGFRTG